MVSRALQPEQMPVAAGAQALSAGPGQQMLVALVGRAPLRQSLAPQSITQEVAAALDLPRAELVAWAVAETVQPLPLPALAQQIPVAEAALKIHRAAVEPAGPVLPS